MTGNTHCWSKELLDYKSAEKLAQSLESIEDVREWYKEDEEKERNFYKKRKEYFDKNVPYDKKYF